MLVLVAPPVPGVLPLPELFTVSVPLTGRLEKTASTVYLPAEFKSVRFRIHLLNLPRYY